MRPMAKRTVASVPSKPRLIPSRVTAFMWAYIQYALGTLNNVVPISFGTPLLRLPV